MYRILSNREGTELILQKKFLWLWLTQQYDIPVGYTWCMDVSEIVGIVTGKGDTSVSEFVLFPGIPKKEYRVVVPEFNDEEDLMSIYPEMFI